MRKTLVAYFSASGVTAELAKELASAQNADLYEIAPATPYTEEDLNWNNKQSRSSVEMNDPAFRPPLANLNASIAEYDVVFVGFPIWWYVAPTIINTFLEAYDFSGKTVILFATSGGSGFGKTLAALKPSVSPTATLQEGYLQTGTTPPNGIAKWAAELNL